MRGQGQGGIATSHTSEPIRVRRPWGAPWLRLICRREDSFTEVLQKRSGTLGGREGNIPLTPAGAAGKVDSPLSARFGRWSL